MTDAEIQNQIAATQALIAENERLLGQQKEVIDELQATMAELLGCSVWDLESQLLRDLSAEDRQELEQRAMAMLREQVPGLTNEAPPSANTPTGMPPPAGAPRPYRRMV